MGREKEGEGEEEGEEEGKEEEWEGEKWTTLLMAQCDTAHLTQVFHYYLPKCKRKTET